ncbi:MAG: hypothetical protein ACXWT1_07470 [Methylobacter sp.]
MEIIEIFKKYTDEVSQIYLHQRAVKDTAKNELKRLIQQEKTYEKIYEENPEELKEIFLSAHSLSFRIAKDNSPYFFKYKKNSLEDKKIAVILSKNKQYQWLLAEAYEAFEDFIEYAYAHAGYTDKNFWPLNDFGNISLSELEEKNFEWFVFRAKEKRDKPQSILSHFRNKFPLLQQIETNNKLNTNLKLAIALVEQLRHHIVHTSGVVSNKEQFIEKILKKSGLYNNGKFDIQHKEFIEEFFGSGDYKNTIALLEISTNPEIPLSTYLDVFECLSGYLMAYAHLVAECLNIHRNN